MQIFVESIPSGINAEVCQVGCKPTKGARRASWEVNPPYLFRIGKEALYHYSGCPRQLSLILRGQQEHTCAGKKAAGRKGGIKPQRLSCLAGSVFTPLGGGSICAAWRDQCLRRLAGPVFVPLGASPTQYQFPETTIKDVYKGMDNPRFWGGRQGDECWVRGRPPSGVNAGFAGGRQAG